MIIRNFLFVFQLKNIDGTIKGGVNLEGVDFYNHLINELLANGML